MDWTSIVVAALACIGTAGGSIYGIRKSSSLIEYRLAKLEEKVGKHNNLIERVYIIENQMGVQSEKIKVANHRIDDLEKGGGCKYE